MWTPNEHTVSLNYVNRAFDCFYEIVCWICKTVEYFMVISLDGGGGGGYYICEQVCQKKHIGSTHNVLFQTI